MYTLVKKSQQDKWISTELKFLDVFPEKEGGWYNSHLSSNVRIDWVWWIIVSIVFHPHAFIASCSPQVCSIGHFNNVRFSHPLSCMPSSIFSYWYFLNGESDSPSDHPCVHWMQEEPKQTPSWCPRDNNLAQSATGDSEINSKSCPGKRLASWTSILSWSAICLSGQNWEQSSTTV